MSESRRRQNRRLARIKKNKFINILIAIFIVSLFSGMYFTRTPNKARKQKNISVATDRVPTNIDQKIKILEIQPGNLFRLTNTATNTTIEAENYNSNQGGNKENCSEGGQNIGSIKDNDWMVYDNINIPTNGQYKVEYRVASQNGGNKIRLEQNSGTTNLGEIEIPKTNGWQNWTTVSQVISLKAGAQSFGIKAIIGGFNINWIKFTYIPEVETVNLNNEIIEITHITMSEFISWSRDIFGLYDIVVIGRENYGLNSEYSEFSIDRDYTNPLSQIRNPLPITSINNSLNSNNKVDNRYLSEYYAENDITTKKAKEIVQMIDSGQLVYMDNKIFDTSNVNKNIDKSKLFNIFNSKSGINLVKDSSNNITIGSIVAKYKSLDERLKRPKVLSITPPKDDENSVAYEENRNMVYNIGIGSVGNEKFTIKLYLDINGDGLYKDKELVETKEITTTSTDAKVDIQEIKYTLSSEFIGYLDWKIDVIKTNTQIKTSILGHSHFKGLNGKKEVRVLQVYPKTTADFIDLSKKDESIKNDFQDILGYDEVKDYDIQITRKSAEELQTYLETNDLNGNYDMIIIGFADTYGNDVDFNEKTMSKIDSFIKTGQSVMFTHDTMALAIADDKSYGHDAGPTEFTQHFRDYVGQARYKDPYRMINNTTTIDEKDIYQNIVNGEYVDKIIAHDAFNVNKINNETVYTIGSTLQGSKQQYPRTQTTKIQGINKAQITEYPFTISESIDVANTHTQWYQLNLEDEDLVPWFNLKSNNLDSGDSRNNYYTYSKGNITYSGTGHSKEFTEDEKKLFVNTIIKANRGANNAPIINALANVTGIECSDFLFNASVKDVDEDWIKLNSVKVDGKDTGITLDAEFNKLYYKEKNFGIKIPVDLLKNETGIKDKIVIQIEAEDEKGAKKIETYTLLIQNLTHGLYNGITLSNNTNIVDQTSDRVFAQKENKEDININFASTFKVNTTQEIKFDLILDKYLEKTSENATNGNENEIRVYTIDKTKQPYVISEFNSSSITITKDNTLNKYTVKINCNISEVTDILVLYTAKTPAITNTFTNKIVVSNFQKEFKIKTDVDSSNKPIIIPDLF